MKSVQGDDMFQVRKADVTARVPPHVFFFVSAIFHYLGPAFAVLLFSSVPVLGVAWFRIASAAVVFAVWRRPWRIFVKLPWEKRRTLLALGVVLGHRIAQDGGAAGIDRLGAAMLIALVTITPIGLSGALPAMTRPLLLLAGVGVGICSSVIPYVCDQLAMARLPRATFALLLSLLPASAAVIGVVVLRQIPTLVEITGILLVAGGVALHQEAETRPSVRTKIQV